jgi:hypothetical protein
MRSEVWLAASSRPLPGGARAAVADYLLQTKRRLEHGI